MCGVVEGALAAVQIYGAVMQYQQQAKMASRQDQSITQNYALQSAQLNQQYQQTNQQAQQQMSQRAKEAMIEEGRLQTAFGESGLQAGGTDGRLAAEISNNADTDIATIEENRARQAEQIHAQGLGLQAQTQSAYNSVKRPSLVGTGLQIAGDVGSLALKKSPDPGAPPATPRAGS